jgi:addiction module HigA family antidote
MRNFPIPKNATPVGEILEEEYRKPLGLTQQQFADALKISRCRYVELAAGKRGVTLDTALRLVRVLGTSPQFWINLQTMHDLSEIAKTAAAAEIAKLKVIVEKTPTATAGREGAREQKQSAKRRSAKSDGTAIVERSSSRRRT